MYSKILHPPSLVLALILSPVALAQSASGPQSVASGHPGALNSAAASAKSGDLAAAETALFSDNVQRPNTLDWEIEATTKLLHLAFTLRQARDYPSSNLVVQRALARLTDASSRHASDTPAVSRAQAYETAGLIYETLLFDPVSSQAAYRQALSLNPSSRAASAGLARIQAAEQVKTRVLGEHE